MPPNTDLKPTVYSTIKGTAKKGEFKVKAASQKIANLFRDEVNTSTSDVEGLIKQYPQATKDVLRAPTEKLRAKYYPPDKKTDDEENRYVEKDPSDMSYDEKSDDESNFVFDRKTLIDDDYGKIIEELKLERLYSDDMTQETKRRRDIMINKFLDNRITKDELFIFLKADEKGINQGLIVDGGKTRKGRKGKKGRNTRKGKKGRKTRKGRKGKNGRKTRK